MPETRKFAQGLKRKGAASSRRESSSLQIRSSVYSDIDLVCEMFLFVILIIVGCKVTVGIVTI